MGRTIVNVSLAERSYPIVVVHNEPAGLGPFIRERTKSAAAFIVTDTNVAPHATAVARLLPIRAETVVLPPGEAQKSLATASQLYDRLADMPADRHTLIIPVGGGVLGDLAGFVAATYARGLPLLMIPTTLLAMVDSSVGGKVGVNHPKAKNLIGAFHQPVGVWIDTAYLQTLPEREYRSGLAEVVKYGVILDAEFFTFLEGRIDAILKREPETIGHVVAHCCRLKADIVEKDEREITGLRAVLNYGHTFAHAFETVAGYGTWLHGEAVAAGMIGASQLAERMGLIPKEVTKRQQNLLQRFGLPTQPENWPVSELLAVMRNDKKAVAGKLRLVLPKRLGEVALVEGVGEKDVESVLASCKR